MCIFDRISAPMTRSALRPRPWIDAIRPPRPPRRRVRLRQTPSSVREPLWMCTCRPVACPGRARSDGSVIPSTRPNTNVVQHGALNAAGRVESMMGRRRPWGRALHPVASQTAPAGVPNEMEQKTPARARSKAPNSPPCPRTSGRADGRPSRSPRGSIQEAANPSETGAAGRRQRLAHAAQPPVAKHQSAPAVAAGPNEAGKPQGGRRRSPGPGLWSRGVHTQAKGGKGTGRGGQRNNGGGFGILGAKRARGRPTRSARPALALGPDLPGASLPYSGSFNCLRGSTGSQNRSNMPSLDRSSAGLGPKARSCEAKGLIGPSSRDDGWRRPVAFEDGPTRAGARRARFDAF